MVAVVDGQLAAGDKLAAVSTGQQYDILEVSRRSEMWWHTCESHSNAGVQFSRSCFALHSSSALKSFGTWDAVAVLAGSFLT